MADVFAYLYGFGAGGDFTKSVIIVTDLPTGATVTATKGPIKKTSTEKNGEWWFKGLDLGEWTLDAAIDGETATTKFNIERFGVYYVPMSFFKATIQTKYPVGSTCTCSKGDKTFTAPDTSGQYDFVVDSAGEWTVSCTDGGTNKKSIVVNITDGETKNVILVYGDYLYFRGDQSTSLTDGWEKNTTSLVEPVFNEDNIQLQVVGSSASKCGVQTKSSVNLTGYKTLKITGTVISVGSGSTPIFRFGVMPNKNSDLASSGAWSSLKTETITQGDFEIDVDINSVNSGYVTLSTGGGIQSDVKIYTAIIKQ